jgi:hypothetical protein
LGNGIGLRSKRHQNAAEGKDCKGTKVDADHYEFSSRESKNRGEKRLPHNVLVL